MGELEQRVGQAREAELPIANLTFENEVIAGLDLSKIEFENVIFRKCRFIECEFEGASFYNSKFISCDLSNCIFYSSYWKKVMMEGCKGDGAKFSQSTLKEVTLKDSSFHYVNCGNVLWDNAVIVDCDFKEAFLSEMKWKKVKVTNVNFTSVDFFKTPLKGMDLSDCMTDNIMVSDTYQELQGVKLNMFQAAAISKMLGIQIV